MGHLAILRSPLPPSRLTITRNRHRLRHNFFGLLFVVTHGYSDPNISWREGHLQRLTRNDSNLQKNIYFRLCLSSRDGSWEGVIVLTATI